MAIDGKKLKAMGIDPETTSQEDIFAYVEKCMSPEDGEKFRNIAKKLKEAEEVEE